MKGWAASYDSESEALVSDYLGFLVPLLLVLLVAFPAYLITWAVRPESRLPAVLEACAPLKGRWLRYFVAALLLPLSLLLPFVAIFILLMLPAPVGVVGVTAFIGWWIRRVTSAPASLPMGAGEAQR